MAKDHCQSNIMPMNSLFSMIRPLICLLALAAGVSSYVYYRSHLIVAKNEYVGILEQGLWGNCRFGCLPSGNPENYCASWWVDFVNLCVYIGGPYGIADDEI